MFKIRFGDALGLRLKGLVLLASFAVLTCGSIPALADDGNGDNGNGDKGTTLLVDDDKVECPTAKYKEIQDAVVAAPPGATIHVCPGTYKVQVMITQPLKIVADSGSILKPTKAVPNATSFNTSNPPTAITALLLVSNTHDVSINDLTVDGASASPTGCSTDYVGVMYQNASGTLTNMAVRNIKLAAGSEGCQSGEGIFVQSRSGEYQVDISDSSVHDYQKTGIIIDGSASESTVNHNYVTGIGSTPNIAQNGIQISRGASASVTNNFVNNHLYALCTSPMACPFASVNILVFNSNGITLRNNTVGTAQIGIYIGGNNAQVQNNDVYDNKVFDGIDLVGNNNHAGGNNVFHSDSAGIVADGNNNHIDGNTINEAQNGTVTFGSGNQVNGNKYFNVVVLTSSSPNTVAPILNSPARPPQVSAH